MPHECLSCIRLCAFCNSILSQKMHKQMQSKPTQPKFDLYQCLPQSFASIWALHCAYCQHDVQEPPASTSARMPFNPAPPKRSPLYKNSTMYGQQVRPSALPQTPGMNTSVSIHLCVCVCVCVCARAHRRMTSLRHSQAPCTPM